MDFVFGAGGHARVVVEAALAAGAQISIILDDDPSVTEIFGIPVKAAAYYRPGTKPDRFIVAIGNNNVRACIFSRLKRNCDAINVIHPFTMLSPDCQLGVGVAVLAGAVIQCGSIIGDDVILNTSCSIDHDCRLGAHVHIGPGAHLAGNVTVGAGTLIGTGASVIPGATIGTNCVIGAGSAVVSDVPNNSVAVGVPARLVRATAGVNANI